MKRYPSWLAPILIGAVLGLFAATSLTFGIFETLAAAATDRFFLPRDPDPSAIIVSIDDSSLTKIGRWPWPRTIHAELIDTLKAASASVIALDVNFPEPSNTSDDRRLAEAVRGAGNVVLPVELAFVIRDGALAFNAASTVQPIATIQSSAAGSGFSNVPLDDDNIARRIPLAATGQSGTAVYAFAYEAARLMGRAPAAQEIPTDVYGRFLINFAGAPRRTFPIVPASDVLQGTADMKRFKDKVVFIGATARNLHDEQNVSTSAGEPMSGVEIHASVYDTLVTRRWLMPAPVWLQALAYLLIGLLLGLIIPRVRARTGALIVFSLFVVSIVGAFLAFDRGWIINIIWPTVLLVLAYGALLLERWVTSERARRQIRNAFSRYVSENVVASLLEDLDKLKLGGQRRTMTVLFSDLRGFTTLSEGMTPEQLVDVLNKYLHEMTDIVFAEGGTLDKYIGDAVMAFWNAPFDQKDHAARGVRAAIRMKTKLSEMNTSGAFPSGITLKVGVGLNTGDMVVGNIGGEKRYDYTVIGDSVNLASRTESLCKEYGAEIIITQNTRQELGDGFVTRLLDQVAVKGKKEPIKIYEVMGETGRVDEAKLTLKKDFEQAFDLYVSRKFVEAAGLCERILHVWSEDLTTQHLLERCRIYEKIPPPEGWDGTWVMTKK